MSNEKLRRAWWATLGRIKALGLYPRELTREQRHRAAEALLGSADASSIDEGRARALTRRLAQVLNDEGLLLVTAWRIWREAHAVDEARAAELDERWAIVREVGPVTAEAVRAATGDTYGDSSQQQGERT